MSWKTLKKDMQKNFLNEQNNKKKFLYGWKKYTQWTTFSGKNSINLKLPIQKYFIRARIKNMKKLKNETLMYL